MIVDSQLPRVLVACPTARAKDYCFEAWLRAAMSLTYPNYDIVVFDNSTDEGRFMQKMNRVYRKTYGYDPERRFKAHRTSFTRQAGVIERICRSHQQCAEYAISKGYDYLLHLESDVIPPQNVIEELLVHKKKVISALYYSDSGCYRRPMVQMRMEIMPNYGSSYYLSHTNEITHLLVDKPQRIALAGLGCTLINTTVFEKIKFRWERGVDKHPDTFFAEDCEKIGLPIYLASSIVCEHHNQAWGVYNIDYN